MNELKPCPFCGGKAKIVTSISKGIPPYPTAYIECEICAASTRAVADLEWDGSFISSVVELWNERNVGTEPVNLSDLYLCDPDKNTECKKTACYRNGGECIHTVHKEYRRVD